jgi:hypothetical protein
MPWQWLIALIFGSLGVSVLATAVALAMSVYVAFVLGRKRIHIGVFEVLRGEWPANMAKQERMTLTRYRRGLALTAVCGALALLLALAAVALRPIVRIPEGNASSPPGTTTSE